MSSTITLGKSGRLVVPKAIRDSLGLREGSRLKVEVHGGRLEAVPVAEHVPVVMENGFPVFQSGKKITNQELVDIIKSDREARDLQIINRSGKNSV